ncbi:MAG TPA: exo-alpha-sialidase, partial [Planctomycetaceae bacterium]|nr:exo-alpha-sialidase [Planctomycetaceae bacterium]
MWQFDSTRNRNARRRLLRRPKSRHQRRRSRCGLRFEPLEQRMLLAIDFTAGPLAAPTNNADVALGPISGFAPVEPTVVVNPVDPANLAVSSHEGLRVSTNAGGTFSAVTNFPPATAQGGDADLIFDSQGRLFWSNIAGPTAGAPDITVARMNPTTGALIASAVVQNDPGAFDDKEFITADQFPASPHTDNLYVVWTKFGATTEVVFSRSTNQGASWSAPIQLSNSATEGFVWPSDVGVAPNGDVYVAYHAQPNFNGIGDLGGNPDGTSGRTLVRRSTDGGVSFSAAVEAFGPGQSDVTFNIQNSLGNIPGTDFWMQGQAQPWVLPDPVRPGNVYIIASDDPDDVHGTAGDDVDIVIARSTDNGATWTQATVPVGAASHQFFPTAAIDEFGNIVVVWYDSRRGLSNAGGNLLLDVMATYSTDGGVTWAPAFMVSDPANPFDPDIGAVNRTAGPPPTTRIGEYIGVDLFGGTAHVVWNGPNPLGGPQAGHQVIYDRFAIAGSLTVSGDDAGVADDDIVIRSIAGNPGSIEVLVNGQRQYAGLREGLSGGITVNGLGGSDTLTIDYSNGDPIPPAGLIYDGGESAGDNDVLVVTGYDAATVTSTYTGVDTGTVQV